MGCKKCTTTPPLPRDSNHIILFASHEYMLQKILENFNPFFKIDFESLEYLKVYSDLEGFLNAIKQKNVLTQIELENISLIPLESEQPLTFSLFKKAKSLDYYLTLYNSMDLKWILENESIQIFFQPIVSVKTNEIVAYECLARGKKADGSLMPPKDMFETAIKAEMIFNLDRQCRMQALKQAKNKNLDKVIFINFNPASIYDPELCLSDTIKVAKELNYDYQKVVFEVVESSKIDKIDHLKSILDYYTEMGFKVALDDVGSGYSSLKMLASLKPNVIKIDMDLIRDIHNDSTKRAIVSSLINLAHDIGATTLAEGIEKQEEFEIIKELGADLAQGYLFGKPSPDPFHSS